MWTSLVEVDVLHREIHENIERVLRNQHRPEGCIIECYIAEKAVEFCFKYLANA